MNSLSDMWEIVDKKTKKKPNQKTRLLKYNIKYQEDVFRV